ncbi:MAG: hypothetical protein AB7R00_07035 [Kofleriaceae bacterium]
MDVRAIVIATLLTSAVGCDVSVEHREDRTSAVWSDDGAEIATFHREYSVLVHGGLKGGTIEDIYDVRFTPHVRDVASGTERAVGDSRDGVPFDLYWMRTQGYLVMSYVRDDVEYFEYVNAASGQAAELRPPCRAIDRVVCTAIPSPDGTMIAVVEQALVANRMILELHRASDLALVVRAEHPSMQAVEQMTWHPDGSFLFSVNSDTSETWRLTNDGLTRQVTPPGCFAPSTTSSQVDGDGRVVAADGTITGEIDAPFGCQVTQ